MRMLLALSLAAACTPTQRTVALGTVSTALLAVDWHQSRGITRQCLELNPLIGPCGERTSPDVYFPAVTMIHLAIGALLPSDARDAWFGAIGGLEAATVWSNASVQ